ncbi:MAG: carbohydrate-binding family 9-like protein [Kiritimatiellia bacterium]|nr:carbohydrate-binding family 9-like protein [Kiritimatiellia bacterium]
MMQVCFSSVPPALDSPLESEPWSGAEAFTLSHARPEGSSHCPRVTVRLLHDREAVSVRFQVWDRHILCRHTAYQDPVCRDSCVEWFAQPRPDKGYVNFEINCGGALHCSYIEDPTRTPQGFARRVMVPEESARLLTIHHTLPSVVDPAIDEPTVWEVGLRVPFVFWDPFTGPTGPVPGQTWRGNFYKCGGSPDYRHWLSWQPVGELNFHRPQDFGPFRFA